MKDYSIYQKIYYSQSGEDGIVEEIFKRLKTRARGHAWFVDVGAWDGIYLSNTYFLVGRGWRGLEIEADKRHFGSLISNMIKNPKIKLCLYTITPETINTILGLYPIPHDFDLISIDIDSCDYYVWKELIYEPKVVIVETNSRKGEFVSTDSGASLDSLVKLGKEKGYTLVAFTGNAIFVRDDYLHLL